MIQVGERRCRIESQTCPTSMFSNKRQTAINVLGGFGMKRNYVSPGLGKHGNKTVHGLDHQVHVNWNRRIGSDRFAKDWSECQIRNVVIIHDVKVNKIGTGFDNISDFIAQSGKVGG